MKINLRYIRASLYPENYPGRRDFHGGASKEQIIKAPTPTPTPPTPTPAPTPTPSN